MSAHRFFAAVLVLCSAGCREDNLVPDPNRTPEAVARVIAENGDSVDETVDGGGGPRFAFDGTPVEIQLDGSRSSDVDGEIRDYRWLSGTTDVDAGGGRLIPEDQDAGWPRDAAKPTVRLGEGVWTFTLWVEDDDGAISQPDTITFTVGDPAPAAPPPSDDEAIAQCVDGVVETVPEACKQCVCTTSEECRMAADQSVCGEACWGLLDCIGVSCPEFSMNMDVACLTTNCAEFLAEGGSGATTIGPCVTGCIDDCRD